MHLELADKTKAKPNGRHLYPVKIPLTQPELLAYTDELTATDTRIKDVTLELEAIKNNYKTQLKELQQNQERFLHLLKVKEEVKEIECYWYFNYFDGIVETRRADNDLIVNTRRMTAEEYQRNLPLEKPEEAENEQES